MTALTPSERVVADRLGEALAHGLVGVAFQPVVDLERGRLRGVEALARWDDPHLGRVKPAAFVAVAERAGLIGALGAEVLARATDALAGWRALPGAGALTVSVNVSARQLEDATLPALVRSVLADAGLPAEALVLELTETALIPPEALATVAGLARVGVGLSLDDFGTGFSSPTRLGALAVDEVKLDRRFVSARSGGLPPIALALIRAGENAGLRVIAEGIETEGERRALVEAGCRHGQGFLLGRPGPAEQIAALLAGR